MPIDAMMLDPMLGTFRTMMQEIEDKGITTDNAKAMREALDRMEELGAQHSDFNAFNADMMNENLFGKFSDHYGKALGEEASANANAEGGYDDAALLKQTVDALKNAVKEIERGKQAAIDETNKYGAESNTVEVETLIQNDAIIDAINNLIAKGEEPGMTLPRFMRIQIEEGLDKAMEGTALVKDGMVYQRGWVEAHGNQPYHLAEINDTIAAFDKMAGEAAFGTPDALEFQFVREAIARDYLPKKQKYEWITRKWEQVLDYLDTWIRAHTKFAPVMDPWKMIQDPEAKKRAIERAKDCAPGEMKVVEKMIGEYFGLSFDQLWQHESFHGAVKSGNIAHSEVYFNFLTKEVYPQCKPFSSPSQDIIAKCEQLWEGNVMYNPDLYAPAKRQREHYNAVFGEGRYEQKFGALNATATSNAAPWSA